MTSLACLFCECAADRTEVEMPWSALEVIDCTSNSIRELDRSLGLFPHVLELNISDNGISELSPAIRNLRALTMLSLAQNEISSIRALLGAEQMPYLTKLTSLILSENKIDSLLGLERLTSLRHLDISRNKIKDFDEVRTPTSPRPFSGPVRLSYTADLDIDVVTSVWYHAI
jgi:Leucine-rich repeat (LRR) protein